MNRQEKLRFLKGLKAGQRSISEIKPSRVILFIHYNEDEFYEEACMARTKWTLQDMEAHREKYPEDRLTVINVIGSPPE